MRPGWSKDVVAATALASALGLGGFLFLRARGAFGASWSDGQRRFDSATGSRVRHAVWDEPEVLAELGQGSAPALSPDGRWLVFASGARGLNAELFVAERRSDGTSEPRVLFELDTPADELAPAFGDGFLYFASDRDGGAGGLDLWRARYRDGEFGRAEPVPPGINSAADETDPAPLGARTLVFASDRARPDLDLYAATPEASGFHSVEPLAALNTADDEQGPAFAGDGRSLYFASDRPGGTGDFDLYRARAFDGAWQPPERLVELCGPGAERSPCVAGDGFELYFEREHELGPGLARARSRELFRLPAPAVTLTQWLTLAALLLLALLAQLAKRWHALDILYKCFLVSLLLHLLLMLYLRTLAPGTQSHELGPREGPSFRVRVAPPESAPSGGSDGDGLADLARRRFEPENAPQPAPEELALRAPERSPEAAPARSSPTPAPTPSPLPATALAAPAEPLERRAEPAPELRLAARTLAAPIGEVAAPARARMAENALEAPAPVRASLPAIEASAGELALAPQHGTRPVRASDPAPAAALAVPREPLQRSAAETPGLALEALSAPRAEPTAGTPARARLEPEATPTATPSPGLGAGALVASAASAELPSAPPRGTLGAPVPSAASEASAPVGPALRLPAGDPRPERAAPSPGFDALAELDARAAPLPFSAAPPSPARARAAPTSAPPRPQPSPARIAAAAPREEPAPPERQSLPRLAETPYQNRFGAQKLRALEEFGGTPESEHAVAAGLAYLARIQGENGAWGERGDAHAKYLDVRIGKSALALLAFLGAGHVPGGDTPHAEVAARAVRYLLGTQDAPTGHFGRSCSYGHGIATYALAECYALTQAAELRAPLERAVQQILRHQDGTRDARLFGGWGYYFADGHVWGGDEWPRTSVTAWQVMALESARLGGLDVPDAAFADAREFLLHTWDERRGAFRYDHDPERLSSGYPILPASTPAALFALALLDVDPAAEDLAAARRFVLTRAPDGYRYTGDDDFVRLARGNPYFWYYATLALFRVGGREWERWNTALQATLLPAQEEDGSWAPIDVYSEYAGDDDDERTYATAMCVLSLEVYYRYFTPLLRVK